MGHDEMRAGDGDRHEVAEKLRVALGEGRLDLNEYDERLQKTLAARTYGDLNGLLNDLPGTIPEQRSQVVPHPTAHATTPAPAPSATKSRNFKQFSPYAGVVAVTVLIWAISSIAGGELRYFWPAWVAFPLLLGIIGQLFKGSSGPGGEGKGEAGKS